MADYIEFEFESLTVREWTDILAAGLPDATNDKHIRFIEIMQAHTNADIMSIPAYQRGGAVRQFSEQFREYSKDHSIFKSSGNENG